MASPPRPQPQTTPATRAELTSVSSDMRTHMERMEERIGATMQEMLVQTMHEMHAHQQQNMQSLMDAINNLEGTLRQEISTHACRGPDNPFRTGLGSAERTQRLEGLDASARNLALAARTSGGTAPGGLAVRGSAPGSAPRQERAPHEFESPEGKVGGAKALCKVCNQHRSAHPTSK